MAITEDYICTRPIYEEGDRWHDMHGPHVELRQSVEAFYLFSVKGPIRQLYSQVHEHRRLKSYVGPREQSLVFGES